MESKILVECKALSISIGWKKVLKECSFTLPANGITILSGENGAGKSTLLGALTKYHKHPDSIQVFPRNSDLFFISYLGHELGLYTSLSLEENLRYFQSIASRAKDWNWIMSWVEKFRLSTRMHDPVYSFSRGMKQKAALIRTFLAEADLILLDEPHTGMDISSVELLDNLIQEAAQRSSILIVSHEKDVIGRLKAKSLKLEGGTIG